MKIYKSNETINPQTGEQSITYRIENCRRRLKILMLRGLIDPDVEGLNAVTISEGAQTSADTSMTEKRSRDSNNFRIGIRRKVLEFFNREFGLAKEPEARLVEIMTELYDSSLPDQVLIDSLDNENTDTAGLFSLTNHNYSCCTVAILFVLPSHSKLRFT